jgi:membrane protease YdiL (CAAX protease family)
VSTLIPIPEAHTYGVTLLVLYASAPFALSAHLQGRWGGQFLAVHCGVLAGVVLGGTLLLGPAAVVGGTPLRWLIALPPGAAAGVLVTRADQYLTRRLARLAARGAGRSGQPGGRVTVSSRPLATGDGRRRRLGGGRGGLLRPAMSTAPMPLALLVGAAVLEELVYRGILVRLAFELPNPAAVAFGLAGLTVVFLAGHGFLGWTQLVVKIPLAVVTLGLTLVTGTAVAAAVTHAMLNADVWRQRRNWVPPTMRDLSAARATP